MKNTPKFFIIASLGIFIFSASNLYASPPSKNDLINKEMDCVSRRFNNGKDVKWADVCYSEASQSTETLREEKIDYALEKQAKEMEQAHQSAMDQLRDQSAGAKVSAARRQAKTVSQERPSTEAYRETFKEAPPKKSWMHGLIDRQNPLRKFELGTEAYRYRYQEPSLSVKDSGNFYGVYSRYTFRLSENQHVKSLKDVFSDQNKINMFRLEGRFALGNVDYEGSGTYDGIRDYVTEIRGLAGYDIPLGEKSRVTPYVGIGYRYLLDKFSEVPAQTINGQNFYSGYDRESKYLYIPTGVEVETKLENQWTVGATLEYDWFGGGSQTSHLEDMHTANGTNAGFDALKNTQNKGRGARGSVRVMRETEKLDFWVEPFVRYWHIQQSSIDFVTAGGSLICNQNDLCEAGAEPENDTTEIGFKLGVRY